MKEGRRNEETEGNKREEKIKDGEEKGQQMKEGGRNEEREK